MSQEVNLNPVMHLFSLHVEIALFVGSPAFMLQQTRHNKKVFSYTFRERGPVNKASTNP